MKKPRVPESLILKTCLASLEYASVFHYRNNTGAMVGEYKGKKRFIRYGVAGAPDIVAVWGGLFVGIECKSSDGRLSEDQKRFGAELEKAGGVYAIVRDIETANGLGEWVKNRSGT